ncbi:hypothetical protein [Clostridium sp. HBUAS56017]|uniref:hypothetical protein n=1 Tax=Clostridium sp. HBUAS56017 TaxID=2571128 RepID=UPI001177AF7F|nr:hypothetical protein [Clostridium sp. HBUAS56017]
MRANIINKLTVQFNEQEYREDEIYLTIGIKSGFCIDKMLLLPKNEIKEVNQASGDVLINYMDIIMREKYDIRIKGDVKTDIIYISTKTKKERLDDVVTVLLKTLYEEKIDEEIFCRAKEAAKNSFSYNYKIVECRAYYHMMEFSNVNKSFNLEKLTKDYLSISFQDFKEFTEEIVVLPNSILFINGDLSDLNKSKMFKYIESIKTKETYVMPIAKAVNKYLQSDVHLIDTARKNTTMGGINFNFFNEDITYLEKQLLLSVINEIMFKEKGLLLLDEFDNSLIYFNTKLGEYSTKILKYLNEENVSKAKDAILYKLAYTLEKKPYIFNKYCIDLFSKGIDFDDYFEALNICDYELLKKIYIKGNLKITESHLLYKKKEA